MMLVTVLELVERRQRAFEAFSKPSTRAQAPFRYEGYSILIRTKQTKGKNVGWTTPIHLGVVMYGGTAAAGAAVFAGKEVNSI